MLGIGWGELLVIFAVIVIFADPKDIPGLARNLAEIVRKFRSMSNEFTGLITKEIEQPQKFIKDLNGEMQPTYDLTDLKTPPKPSSSDLPKGSSDG